ncbi:hypothetical protein LEP1GSC195_0235 [Leptospira wolbachii serovar Codice str. CDC]|uniref:Uncharacterized protein n=1 Tax=Leptospira wolbachii serovar Codice str. CDC TaxID=1218599 RepID=R9A6E0_9LEPT|nr:hypothetical protein LEP1GSC195_0235 [Leptospira wolbachii serovar Codice str. CDC]
MRDFEKTISVSHIITEEGQYIFFYPMSNEFPLFFANIPYSNECSLFVGLS